MASRRGIPITTTLYFLLQIVTFVGCGGFLADAQIPVVAPGSGGAAPKPGGAPISAPGPGGATSKPSSAPIGGPGAGGTTPGPAGGATPGPAGAPIGGPGSATSGPAGAPIGGPSSGTIFEVTKYGAIPDGKTDMMMAFLKTWVGACNSPTPSTIVIPAGDFLCGLAVVTGPCKAPIEVQVLGTISAKDPIIGDNWFVFKHIENFVLSGTGTFDGKGAGKTEPNAANLRFQSVTNGLVTGITSKDSNFFHMAVLDSKNVTFTKVNITAAGDSLNTDGIHLSMSSDINIIDVTIATGDDCISMVDGVTNVNIEGVTCGPGHGIAIGSLGKYPNESPVTGIHVKNCTLKDTENGVRIKSWPDQEAGVASDIHFDDITLDDVQNAIIIDQEYCPDGACKSKGPSKVKISNVTFTNIHGTTTDPDTITLKCSSLNPCEGIALTDIDLTCTKGGAKSTCINVKPIISGKPPPPGC
ncbi:unnamed protein product [Linum trigynum]|uniref:Polygalacturonase n=1 Tax=Linum trigynum TaxID=586398 RepID=A0AAV2GIZ4_9ROSI